MEMKFPKDTFLERNNFFLKSKANTRKMNNGNGLEKLKNKNTVLDRNNFFMKSKEKLKKNIKTCARRRA